MAGLEYRSTTIKNNILRLPNENHGTPGREEAPFWFEKVDTITRVTLETIVEVVIGKSSNCVLILLDAFLVLKNWFKKFRKYGKISFFGSSNIYFPNICTQKIEKMAKKYIVRSPSDLEDGRAQIPQKKRSRPK